MGAVRFGLGAAPFTEVMKAGEVLAQESRFWGPFGHDPWEQREELRDLNPWGIIALSWVPVEVNVLKYNFLMLCLLFWIPAVLAYVSRPDLRGAMRLAALCSLPFAFSEFLFYPDYWAPTFLFDLGDRLGFGIEDFLFVSALAANAVSIYGVLSSRTYAPQDAQVSPGTLLKRLAFILALVLVLVVFAMKLSIPMIYALYGDHDPDQCGAHGSAS